VTGKSFARGSASAPRMLLGPHAAHLRRGARVNAQPVDRDPRKQEKEARKQEKEARKQEREARKQGKDAKWREKTQEWREVCVCVCTHVARVTGKSLARGSAFAAADALGTSRRALTAGCARECAACGQGPEEAGKGGEEAGKGGEEAGKGRQVA